MVASDHIWCDLRSHFPPPTQKIMHYALCIQHYKTPPKCNQLSAISCQLKKIERREKDETQFHAYKTEQVRNHAACSHSTISQNNLKK